MLLCLAVYETRDCKSRNMTSLKNKKKCKNYSVFMNCSAARLIPKKLVSSISHKRESQSQTRVCIHNNLKRKERKKGMKKLVIH